MAKATFEQNVEKTASYREAVSERGIQHLINGEWVDGLAGRTFQTFSPFDNSLICAVAEGGGEDNDRAATAAMEAFDGWASWKTKARRDVLYTFAELIVAIAERISLLESLDTGQPIRFMSKAALRGAANFTFFADRVESARDGLTLPSDEHLNYTVRYPYWSSWYYNAMEHALYVEHVENSASLGRRLVRSSINLLNSRPLRPRFCMS